MSSVRDSFSLLPHDTGCRLRMTYSPQSCPSDSGSVSRRRGEDREGENERKREHIRERVNAKGSSVAGDGLGFFLKIILIFDFVQGTIFQLHP